MEIVDCSKVEVDGSIWVMFILLHGHVCLLLTRGLAGPWFGVRNTQGVGAQQWQARDLIQSFLVSSESPCLCPQETIEQQHHLSLSVGTKGVKHFLRGNYSKNTMLGGK